MTLSAMTGYESPLWSKTFAPLVSAVICAIRACQVASLSLEEDLSEAIPTYGESDGARYSRRLCRQSTKPF